MRIIIIKKRVSIFLTAIVTTGAVLAASAVLNTETVSAQYQGAVYTGEERSLICRGDRDYQTFMSAIISYDGFIEYWKDILVRYNFNYCLYQDIENLYNRLGKVRKQVREAFYSCADETTTRRLRDTYYELETMLFFLRKYVDVDNGNFIVRKDEDVIEDLKGFYVFNSGIFTNEKIMQLYAEFKARYEPRTKIYADCEDASWQLVIDKWNEFKESAGGITPALKQAKESAEKRWARLSESAKGIGDNFINGPFEVKINGLSAKEGLAQIAKEFEKNMPSGVTFETLSATVSAREQTYDYDRMQAKYETDYWVLYHDSSDEITRQIDNRLKLLDNIIINAFPFQNQTINCVKDINNHQC